MYGIYANIWGILMGSMLPYIAAPWIRHGIGNNFMEVVGYTSGNTIYIYIIYNIYIYIYNIYTIYIYTIYIYIQYIYIQFIYIYTQYIYIQYIYIQYIYIYILKILITYEISTCIPCLSYHPYIFFLRPRPKPSFAPARPARSARAPVPNVPSARAPENGPVHASTRRMAWPWSKMGKNGDLLVERCGKMWKDVERCGKMWKDVERCGKMWKNVERCGKMWKDVESEIHWK